MFPFKIKAIKHFQPTHFKQSATMSSAHPGFKAVQAKIARKEGISKEEAGAELASRTRNASAKAKRANPRLKNVKPAKPKKRYSRLSK